MSLESFQSAQARGAEILAELSGYGCATDTHHPTQPAPDGQGPFLAMSRCLESAALKPEDVDYINAHGTATLHNDAAEAAAIARLFQDKAPQLPVSSTKSMVGHALGGAGAIEAGFSVMAIREQKLPPTINVRKTDEACTFRLVANKAEFAVVRHVLSNSLGFGGTNASLLFSAVTP
jgi:3-oxoacyl-[acyl-carrier-protein] synthase II